jgi:hypothetical protein
VITLLPPGALEAQVCSLVVLAVLHAETPHADTQTRSIHKARLHVIVSDQEIISN